MNKSWFLLLLILVGIIIIALPDSGDRLFSISKEHGPSRQDGIGLVLILIPYMMLVMQVWKKKEKLVKYRDSKWFRASLFLAGLGSGLLIASVISDYKYWWVYGIIVLIAVQAVAFYLVLK